MSPILLKSNHLRYLLKTVFKNLKENSSYLRAIHSIFSISHFPCYDLILSFWTFSQRKQMKWEIIAYCHSYYIPEMYFGLWPLNYGDKSKESCLSYDPDLWVMMLSFYLYENALGCDCHGLCEVRGRRGSCQLSQAGDEVIIWNGKVNKWWILCERHGNCWWCLALLWVKRKDKDNVEIPRL